MIELDDRGEPLWARPEDVLSIEIDEDGGGNCCLQVRVAGYGNAIYSRGYPFNEACEAGHQLAAAVLNMRAGQ